MGNQKRDEKQTEKISVLLSPPKEFIACDCARRTNEHNIEDRRRNWKESTNGILKKKRKGKDRKKPEKRKENEHVNTRFLARRSQTAQTYRTQKQVTRRRKRHYERDA